MIPVIGFAFLLLVFATGIALPALNFFFFKKTPQIERLKISYALSFLTLVSAVLAQTCLIYSFIISDYSVANVYKNSHHLKPLIYKISGSWGNHEGSMLLLLSIISAYSLAFNFLSRIEAQRKLIISSTQSAIIGFLAAFTAFTSNPFERIFPTPNEGLSLNPILQDIGLALHPPMLYTGYIGFSLIFSFAIAGLLSEKIDKKFSEFLKPWLFFSYGFLTLGIGLGSWWAYRELGWGGYWFWDPVENVSLMPWIAATALIHCVMILSKKEIFKNWTAFLSILSFILCLLGIFLVRSGVLTSVHSFAIDAGRGFFVIALITLIGGFGLLVLGAKMPRLKSEEEKINFFSKTGSILINNYFLILALFIVLLGTTYPIFLRGIFDRFISIGPDYYNRVLGILIIPFFIFLALSNCLDFFAHTKKQKIINARNGLILLVALAITSLTFFYSQKAELLQLLILFLAVFTALMTVFSSSKNLTMVLSHTGFCLVIIGIVLTSSFGLTKETNLKITERLQIGNFNLTFDEIEYLAGKNFLVRQGNFSVESTGITLKPQLRYYPGSEQTTNESSIDHGFLGDLYLVIGNKDESDNYAIRVYYKPFIYLIWLGCALIFGAAMQKISRRKK